MNEKQTSVETMSEYAHKQRENIEEAAKINEEVDRKEIIDFDIDHYITDDVPLDIAMRHQSIEY